MMPNFTFKAERVLDSGVAALAALSAGFVLYAMPDPVFTGLVTATRLPDVLPAAQPPLGDTARYAAVAGAALLAFAFVLAVFAAIDRLQRRQRKDVVDEAEAPRLRRSDAHPDAPSRRPLIAGRDLGEPLELDVPAAPPEAEVEVQPEARPLPAFLIPEDAQSVDVEPEREPEPEPLSELAARVPEVHSAEDQSLSQLVSRIEGGLSRKRQALPSEVEAEAAPFEETPKVGHRLRSAISELQKISAQGG